MTLSICHLFLLNHCIASLPSFAAEIWQRVQLDNIRFPLRDSAITQSYFFPILLSELVWTLAAAYCKFSMIDQVATVRLKHRAKLSSVVEDLQEFGESSHPIVRVAPIPSRNRTALENQSRIASLPIPPVESFGYKVAKRIFDLFVSLFAAIVLSPLLLTIMILVKLSSPGSIFFCQDRVGRHGRVFTMVKFRTMFLSSKDESDTRWTTTNSDSHITPVGSILRKFSLDELPQLFNVIRGDMSLVGPRPERPYFVAKFRESVHRYNMRHCCQVGITGWAQVNGLRGDTSISDRLKYDLHYIRNWTFAFDLRILARTARVALMGQDGY